MATLSLLGEDGAVARRWDIGDQPVTVGRDATADLVIPDDALSRRHFMISREGGHYMIKDLGSQNGTSVGGQRAQRAQLKQNDCILAGRTLFLFHEHPSPAAVGPDGQPRAHDTAFLPALATERATQPAAPVSQPLG
jgi:pSer/pThr/pTyr-binding forkhead associated (FHA) protein